MIEVFSLDEGLRKVEETLRREAESSSVPILREMALSILEAGGKRLRPRVLLLSFAACGGRDPLPQVIEAAAASELIHTASLIHDDIIDDSPKRRGKSTLHVRYGLGNAIVAGDFLFTRAFGLSGLLGERVVRTATEACSQLAEGEVLEQGLLWRGDGSDDHALDSYLKVVLKKTAAPLKAAAQTGALLAQAPSEWVEALGEYGTNLGVAFQIQDDILDLVGDPGVLGKPVRMDVRHGILTLPTILLSRRTNLSFTDPSALLRNLSDEKLVEEARAIGRKYAQKAKENLEGLPPSPYREELSKMADESVNRSA